MFSRDENGILRMIIAIVALRNLEVHQMDVKIAFLNEDLHEEIYIKQPEGFVVPGLEHRVCKLVKSIYGLKQAPRDWHQIFDSVMLSNGFKINECDECICQRYNRMICNPVSLC